jgi:hypothetical protein
MITSSKSSTNNNSTALVIWGSNLSSTIGPKKKLLNLYVISLNYLYISEV